MRETPIFSTRAALAAFLTFSLKPPEAKTLPALSLVAFAPLRFLSASSLVLFGGS